MKRLLLILFVALSFQATRAQEFSNLVSYYIDNQRGCDSLTVTFTADTSNVRGVRSYQWFFGNGDSTYGGYNHAYTYRSPGNYRPYLQVELEDGSVLKSFLLRDVQVGPLLELMNAFFSKKDGYRSSVFNMHYRDWRPGGAPVDYVWGDGSTEMERYVDSPRVYTVAMHHCNKVLYDTAFAYEIPELTMEVQQIPASWDVKVRLKTAPIYPAAHTRWAF